MARKPKRDLTVDEQLARGPMDLPFLMLVLLLLGIGLIMMFSASYATAYYNDGDPLIYITRQAMFAGVGGGGHVCGLQDQLPDLPMDGPHRAGGIYLPADFDLYSLGSGARRRPPVAAAGPSSFSPRSSLKFRSSCSLPPGCASGTRRSTSDIRTAPFWDGFTTCWTGSDLLSWCPI